MPPHREDGQVALSSGAPAAPPQRERKAKVTPLPLSQMISMTIIIMNESICGTMLMPFIGPFVAFLRGVPINEAGYYSGALVSVFMLGQVVSSKTWGRISDKYGRRFPLISGLFTSGLMMLGFGLSTNVWMCSVFRFFQGLFNGNVLVAKTMMADITDKTNQAGGFSFMSVCSAFGFLIGPALGGLLYDPANSEKLAWVGFDKHGFFATHPAFFASLVVFIYTNIGMLVCTFLVKESNPHAQPLPAFIRLVYPCMWYNAEPFVLPPIQYEDEDEAEGGSTAESGGNPKSAEGRSSSEEGMLPRKDPREGDGRATNSPLDNSFVGAAPFYTVDKEDARQVDKGEQEELVVVSVMRSPRTRHTFPCHSNRCVSSRWSRRSSLISGKSLYDDEGDLYGVQERAARLSGDDMSGCEDTEADALSTTHQGSESTEDSAESSEEVVKKFGYREAFARSYTRFMLSQYMVLSATDMVARDCFPLWAVATTSAGGLGLTSSQVGYILLANSAPCFIANLLFRIVERYFTNKMGLLRVGVVGAGTVVLLLPFNSYLNSSFLMYTFVFVCTGGRQLFCSWCYSLNTMLTARSAPTGHVGSIMGINQSCGALVRGIVPLVSAPMFAWSISGDHIYPFNHAMVFFISALMFYWCWWRSYNIRTDVDGNLQMLR
ncbi:putative transporter [Leptomonas seymouri]|uniref:Putative transporter n=1 Tax=Leptomonas seymouri TaxID=5684 RepID=A0A0N1IMM8_LEPSE|nr:putative transporter [Leptomonas seymouri]|eukprot:KPI90228.1 putative transporter [Leptomonas seymouri]